MLKNKAKFTAAEIKAIFGEENVINVEQSEFVGVSVDTRSLTEGEIFVPLIGEKIDAHELLPDAFSKGASLALVAKLGLGAMLKKLQGSHLFWLKIHFRHWGNLRCFTGTDLTFRLLP